MKTELDTRHIYKNTGHALILRTSFQENTNSTFQAECFKISFGKLWNDFLRWKNDRVFHRIRNMGHFSTTKRHPPPGPFSPGVIIHRYSGDRICVKIEFFLVYLYLEIVFRHLKSFTAHFISPVELKVKAKILIVNCPSACMFVCL